MDVDGLIYQYITRGILNNHKRHVGLELEYPLIPCEGDAVDLNVIRGLFPVLERLGFTSQHFSGDGLPIKATDAQGNIVTFDTSYGILEYVTTNTPAMQPLYRRYRSTIELVQRYLTDNGHMLLGMGINPYAQRMRHTMIDSELTMVINEFFQTEAACMLQARSKYLDFYSNIASEQVHFNTTVEELPTLINAFTYVDFANVLLFANSPLEIGEEAYRCGRLKLYNMSFFKAMGLVGSHERDLKSIEDMVKSYRSLSMFMRHRNGRPEIFPPTPVEEYFTDPRCGAMPEDIFDLDIERNIVTTSYGTAEYRLNCTQTLPCAFVPSAFNLGLRTRLEETLELARGVYHRAGLGDPDDVNEQAALKGRVAGLGEAEQRVCLSDLLTIAQAGLRDRGYGEEAFLAPLFMKGRLECAPAGQFMRDVARFGQAQAVRMRAALGDSLID